MKTIYYEYKGSSVETGTREYEIFEGIDNDRSHKPFCVPLVVKASTHDAAMENLKRQLDKRVGDGNYRVVELVKSSG